MTAVANIELDWIAVDWGTTHLRAYAMSGRSSMPSDHQVLAEAQSADGMAKLAADEFEPALLALIGGWLPKYSPWKK